MLKKYLTIFLCFSFLLGNAVEAAIFNGQNAGAKAKICLTSVENRDFQKERDTRSCNKEINTNNKINKTKDCTNNQKKRQHSPEDLELLARLVHAEAKGEPYEGKVAVAATVLNRTADPSYPDTITEVIYEYDHGHQYCPVRNETINCPADKQAWEAVGEAVEGKDPTGGAVSFYNPAQSDNAWIRGKLYLGIIGNHVFVK